MTEKNIMLKIDQNVPLTYFENPKILARINELLELYKTDIASQIDECIYFIKQHPIGKKVDNFPLKDIITRFQNHFYEEIANEVTRIAFSNMTSTVEEIILTQLSEESFKKAIHGKCMIAAFEDFLCSLPTTSYIDVVHYGSFRMQFNHRFLGTPYPNSNLIN